MHQLRRDCVSLVERQQGIAPEILDLKGRELPTSFTLIGAKGATSAHASVFIELGSNWNGASWGIIYDTPEYYKTINYPPEGQETWYRGFYEYLIRGE